MSPASTIFNAADILLKGRAHRAAADPQSR
jgi:hypothetical protein